MDKKDYRNNRNRRVSIAGIPKKLMSTLSSEKKSRNSSISEESQDPNKSPTKINDIAKLTNVISESVEDEAKSDNSSN